MDKLNPILTGYGVKLRLANADDADFILQLRNMPHVKGKMGDLNISLEKEQAWIQHMIKDPCDYFFIIESMSSKQLGSIGVYNVEWNALRAESGRIVIIPQSLAALPAWILLHDFCFYSLKLTILDAHTLPTNRAVIDLNKQLGYVPQSTINSNIVIDGKAADSILMQLTNERWGNKRDSLIAIAQKTTKWQVA